MTTTLKSPSRATRKTPMLEAVTCSRCGGSGRMPFSVCNGWCFKCHGAGYALTTRGRAASAFLRNLLSKPTKALATGDVFFKAGYSAGSFSEPDRWMQVTSVTLGADGLYSIEAFDKNRVGQQWSEIGFRGESPDTLHRIAHTNAAKRVLQLEAQALQHYMGVNGKIKTVDLRIA